jgi:hypothetical protein
VFRRKPDRCGNIGECDVVTQSRLDVFKRRTKAPVSEAPMGSLDGDSTIGVPLHQMNAN